MTTEMMGIDVDSDGAPIANGEEYGSSKYSSSPSSTENVDSYGCQNPWMNLINSHETF